VQNGFAVVTAQNRRHVRSVARDHTVAGPGSSILTVRHCALANGMQAQIGNERFGGKET
jgi:hypothetical protein